MMERSSANPNSWYANVKNICHSIGQHEAWESESIVSLNVAKQKLFRWYEVAWKNELTVKPKLKLYQSLKEKIGTEMNLKMNLSKHKRSLIAQIRWDCLPLQIELGRRTNVNRKQRLYKLCNDSVEDELHFLFDCAKLMKTRKEMYHHYPELLQMSNNFAKYQLLNIKPYIMGRFVDTMWQERGKVVNN